MARFDKADLMSAEFHEAHTFKMEGATKALKFLGVDTRKKSGLFLSPDRTKGLQFWQITGACKVASNWLKL